MKRTADLVLSSVLALSLAACAGRRQETRPAAPAEPTPAPVEVGQPENREVFQQPMPTDGKVVDNEHGEEVWFAFGSVAEVGDINANGVALSHFFADGHFVHTIQVNVQPAAEGTFYEGWLVNPQSGDKVSVGQITNQFGDARHFVKFEADRDLREYLWVVLTLEQDDGDPAQGPHVARGQLNVAAR